MRKAFIMLAMLRRDEKGATAIEYGLIAALMAVAIIAGMAVLGPALEGVFEQISDKLVVS